MPDPIIVVVALGLGLLVAYGATVYHGFWLSDRAFVQRARGVIAWRWMRSVWYRVWLLPSLPALVPGGVGGLIALAGGLMAGRPVRFELLPGSIGDDLIVVGTGLMVVAAALFIVHVIRPDRGPEWYRAALRHAADGTDPGLPRPRPRIELTATRAGTAVVVLGAIAIVVALVVFSVPVFWVAIVVLAIAALGDRLTESRRGP